MIDSWQILRFPKFEDKRGTLIPYELDQKFPFVVKRVYLVTGKNGFSRGGHAHKQESEVFLVTSGSVKINLHDGKKEKNILLDDSQTAILVPTDCWHEFFEFSEDCVLLCFSSTHYLPGENNYITDKAKFLNRFQNA